MTRSGLSPLQKQLQRGGVLDSSAHAPDALADAAREQGLAFFSADCDRARSRSAAMRAIAKAVDFPEFFGGSFDALYDCLCDTVLDQKGGVVLWLEKLHSGDPALKDDAKRIETVCSDVSDFAKENGRVFAFAISHAGRHPDPVPGEAQSWSATGGE